MNPDRVVAWVAFMLAVLALSLQSRMPRAQPVLDLDTHLRTVMYQALEEAFTEQVKLLFKSWLADDRGQPDRAREGVYKTVRAYRHALTAVEGFKLDEVK